MRVLWAKGGDFFKRLCLIPKLDWSAYDSKDLDWTFGGQGFILTSQRQGRGFIYQASLGKMRRILGFRSCFDKICLTKHSDLLGQLIAKTPMTQADVDELQADACSKNLWIKWFCDSVPGQCACGHHMEVI